MKFPTSKLNTVLLCMCGIIGSANAAQFILVNTDLDGVGFNDPTPAAPIGGNRGTTVGEQRLVAYSRALQLWGSILKSNVPITVLGSFSPRSCLPTTGVLASAGAWNIELNFANAPLANHWYHSALANSLAGTDLFPGVDIIDGADIIAFFNSELGTTACLTASHWYYGLDNNPNIAGGDIDFLDTFMHELSHGLGFSNFVNEQSGAVFGTSFGLPNPDVYMANTRDNVTGKIWNTMTAAEIRAAAVRDGQEVWAGSRVTSNAASVLDPLTVLRITSPAALAGEQEIGRASFGAVATAANFSGTIVVGLDAADAAGPTVNDGCSAFTNAAQVAGNIALVRRGTCGFVVKAKNAQLAGANGVVIANNAAGAGPLGLGGADPTVTIPAVSVSTQFGLTFVAANTPAVGSLAQSATRLAGADTSNHVRVYAPTVVALGSSISHYDTATTPDLLMEPFSTPTPRSASNVDLTAALFQDIGWKTELSIAGCGAGSGAPATDIAGNYYAAPVFKCLNTASSEGTYEKCTESALKSLRKSRLINERTEERLGKCAKRLFPDEENEHERDDEYQHVDH